jgi:hypothetical protein
MTEELLKEQIAINLDEIPEGHLPLAEVMDGETASEPLGDAARKLFVLSRRYRDSYDKSVSAIRAKIAEHAQSLIDQVDEAEYKQVDEAEYKQLIRHSVAIRRNLTLIERALHLAIKENLISQGLSKAVENYQFICKDWRVVSRPKPEPDPSSCSQCHIHSWCPFDAATAKNGWRIKTCTLPRIPLPRPHGP